MGNRGAPTLLIWAVRRTEKKEDCGNNVKKQINFDETLIFKTIYIFFIFFPHLTIDLNYDDNAIIAASSSNP